MSTRTILPAFATKEELEQEDRQLVHMLEANITSYLLGEGEEVREIKITYADVSHEDSEDEVINATAECYTTYAGVEERDFTMTRAGYVQQR